jgi:Family of unknown function (DUF5954)
VQVSALDAPVAELADTEAWRAREEYPQLSFGGPGFGVAREREEGGWELLTGIRELAPQDARDSMGAVFRRMARTAGESGDQEGQAECMRAAERMDAEAVNELTVRGSRNRVARADAFVRSGPSGPERPRPSDPDPGESGRGHELADPAAGFVIDPVITNGMAEGMLKLELLEAVFPKGSVPPEVRADSERAVYAAAVDELDARRDVELKVAGRQFRVVRIGPEGPRPSDYDPQTPVKVQERQLHDRGVVVDEDENAPIELDEDTQRLAGLVRREEQRRRERLGSGDAELSGGN